MSLEIQAGYALVTDVDGHVVHDTRDQLLHVVNTLSGSEHYSSMNWGGSGVPISRQSRRTLGAVHPACTVVFGSMKIVTTGAGEKMLPDDGVWLTAGGTFAYYHKTFETLSGGTFGDYISSLALYSFVLEAGIVYLNQDVVLYDDFLAGPSTDMRSLTVHYRLQAGAFT